jgi:hypothetical protein
VVERAERTPEIGAECTSSSPGYLAHIRWEDAAIALWLVVLAPLLDLAGRSATSADQGIDPFRGVMYIVGVAGAIVCLGARPVGGPPTIGRILGSEQEWVIGPLIGGLAILLSLGVDDLGGRGEVLVLPVIVGSIVVAVLASRLPSVSTERRRLLMLPFILATTDLFQSIIGDIDLGGIVRDATGSQAAGLVGLVLGFAVLGSLIFYLMLIYAPRQVAEHEGTRVGWVVRFGLFVASSVVGLGWLRVV